MTFRHHHHTGSLGLVTVVDDVDDVEVCVSSGTMKNTVWVTPKRFRLFVVYYESLKRELKTKKIDGYRCDERLIKLT